MHRNHFSYHTSSGKMAAYFSTTRDSLGVVHTDSIWIGKKKHLVLMVETSQMITNEIEVQLKDNMMTIEVPQVCFDDNPFWTNRSGQDGQIDINDKLKVIGFYTTMLKSGYKYTHLASEAIDSNLIKVTLAYKALDNTGNN